MLQIGPSPPPALELFVSLLLARPLFGSCVLCVLFNWRNEFASCDDLMALAQPHSAYGHSRTTSRRVGLHTALAELEEEVDGAIEAALVALEQRDV